MYNSQEIIITLPTLILNKLLILIWDNDLIDHCNQLEKHYLIICILLNIILQDMIVQIYKLRLVCKLVGHVPAVHARHVQQEHVSSYCTSQFYVVLLYVARSQRSGHSHCYFCLRLFILQKIWLWPNDGLRLAEVVFTLILYDRQDNSIWFELVFLAQPKLNSDFNKSITLMLYVIESCADFGFLECN